MKREDVKIGMKVIMTKDYCGGIVKGGIYKVLKKQIGGDDCFVLDHNGDESFLAPFCCSFEPSNKRLKKNNKKILTDIPSGCVLELNEIKDSIYIKIEPGDNGNYKEFYPTKDHAIEIVDYLNEKFNLDRW